MTVYSHSRLSSFENCPLQYRYRYIDRIRTGFESIEAFMGKRVHEVLEHVYEDLPRARAEGLQASLDLYGSLWTRHLTPAVKVVRPDLDTEYYRAVGTRCVTGYWEKHFPFPIEPDRIIGVELKVEMKLDPAGKFRMMGFVDRAQHAEPGVIEIHDYKTTATLPKEGSLRYDRQLPLYEIALRQRFPQTKDVRLIWHFLAHGADAVETRTAQDLEQVKRKCIGVIQTVEAAREFPAKKGPLCSWCDYQETCPEWQGVKPVAPPAFPNGRPVEAAAASAAPAPIAATPAILAAAPLPADPKPRTKKAAAPSGQLPLF